jgi:predicted transcriptional regulator
MKGRKTDEVVDARWIIVKILAEQGYHTAKIALLMSMTQRNVTYIINVFQDRLDQYDSLFKAIYQKARVEVGNLNEG